MTQGKLKWGDFMLNVVEAFSGIGSQAEALKNAKIDHNIPAIVEWEVGAMYAYDILHNGPQYLKDYRFHTKDSLVQELLKYNISTNGKEQLTNEALTKLPMGQLKSIYASIERTNNLIDISNVTAKELPEDVDVLTYSFPCQDLSIGSFWHNNSSGIDKDANNRSGLLWQIERLLKDYCNIGKKMPKFLLMENVSAILSKRNIDNFRMWQSFLENLGYINQVYTLNSKNFHIPQNRQRTFMVSVLVGEDTKKRNAVEEYFFENNLENICLDDNEIHPIGKFLRLDYSNAIYKREAIESTPNYTPSRVKIFETNKILAVDNVSNDTMIANTVTTKQDRNPNSGLIEYRDINLVDGAKYRNLTPRECFLLMGFNEESYDLLLENNPLITKSRSILSPSKLYKLAGNSIVVPILEEIFKQIDTIDKKILNCEKIGV